ncbi:MAG: hypothetical protein LBL65_06995 [Campylobacteraceae bacterium]|nr:hypothetical protein [Campylobacteraceae bacterium]
MGKTIMIKKYINITLQDWKIICSIFAYIGANPNDFKEYSSIRDEFEKEVGEINWSKKSNSNISISIFYKLEKIVKKIMNEKWNEYSIITPFSREELNLTFVKMRKTVDKALKYAK